MLFLADGVVHLDRPVEPLDLCRSIWSREWLLEGEMRSDEASEVDDQRPDFWRLSVGLPDGIPVTLGLQQGGILNGPDDCRCLSCWPPPAGSGTLQCTGLSSHIVRPNGSYYRSLGVKDLVRDCRMRIPACCVEFAGKPRVASIALELSKRRVRRIGPAWVHLTNAPLGVVWFRGQRNFRSGTDLI